MLISAFRKSSWLQSLKSLSANLSELTWDIATKNTWEYKVIKKEIMPA